MFPNLLRWLVGGALCLATSGCVGLKSSETKTTVVESKCELRDVYGEKETRKFLASARQHRGSAWYQSDTVGKDCPLWISQFKSDAAQELVQAKFDTAQAQDRVRTVTVCDTDDLDKLNADIRQSVIEDTALENHLNGRCVTPATPSS